MALNTLNQAGAQTPNPRQGSQAGTGYVNLQSFLGANNANNLGNALNQGVSNTVNKTTQNIQQGQQQFNNAQQQENNRINALQGNAQTTLNQITNAPSSTTYSVDAQGNPQQNLINNQNVQDYNKYINTNYQGPQQLSNYNNLLNQYTNASQNANLLGSQGGQQQLLRSYINNPNYTNNLQNLDSLFLGTKPIQQNLQSAKSQALQKLAQNNINNLQATDVQKAQQNAANLQQGQQALGTQTNQDVSNVQNAINQQLQNLSDQSNTANNLANALQSGDFSSVTDPRALAVLNAYRNNPTLGQNAINNYIQNQAAQNLTQAGAASQTQAAQLAALGQLVNNPSLAFNGPVGNAQAAITSFNNQGVVNDAMKRINDLLGANTGSELNNLLSSQGANLTNLSSGSLADSLAHLHTPTLQGAYDYINGNLPNQTNPTQQQAYQSGYGSQAYVQNNLNNVANAIQQLLGINPMDVYNSPSISGVK